jgi:hypothetical protein
MGKRKRRIPRYKQGDPQEIKRRAGYPSDAVEADLTQQVPNHSYSGKPLYYRDVEFDCADCGRHEVWTATQQKWWYEVAKGSLYTTAKRCRACRAVVRAAKERQREASQKSN